MSEEPIVSASIYRKLVAVCKDVTYIQKDKRNAFHNYSYASEAAIKDRLHEAFAKHGLVMLPPEMLSIHDAEQLTKKGDRETVTTIQIRFGIADVDSGESVSGTVYGRGVDSSDKGVYKAITGGLKYFLTTTFLIPTGDDPEEQEQPQKAPTNAKPQRAASQPLPSEIDSPISAMEARMKDKDKYVVLAEFARMKKEWIELDGDAGELCYYDSLHAAGVEKSDQFKTLGESKRAALSMQQALIKRHIALQVARQTDPLKELADREPDKARAGRANGGEVTSVGT